MDTNLPTNPTQQVQPLSQPQPQPIVQPAAPVSVPHKETTPANAYATADKPAFAGTVPHAESVASPMVEELIVPSEPEPIIERELAEHGVEAVVDLEKPQITEEHRKVGIESAKESTPVITQPSGMVQLPMTEEEAIKTIKTTGVSNSKHWLALLIEKVYLQIRGK